MGGGDSHTILIDPSLVIITLSFVRSIIFTLFTPKLIVLGVVVIK